MFLENKADRGALKGRVKVIAKAVLSGHTEQTQHGLKGVKTAGRKVELFKTTVDVRYSDAVAVLHDAVCMQCGGFTHRLTADEKSLVLGVADDYKLLRQVCFIKLINKYAAHNS